MGKTISVTLPENVLEKFEKAAGGQALEQVIAETLIAHQPEAETVDEKIEALAGYSDNHLWAIVGRHLSAEQDKRSLELIEKGKATFLTTPEEAELDNLMAQIDENMLLRSAALAELKQRGYDVSRYFQGTTV